MTVNRTSVLKLNSSAICSTGTDYAKICAKINTKLYKIYAEFNANLFKINTKFNAKLCKIYAQKAKLYKIGEDCVEFM